MTSEKTTAVTAAIDSAMAQPLPEFRMCETSLLRSLAETAGTVHIYTRGRASVNPWNVGRECGLR